MTRRGTPARPRPRPGGCTCWSGGSAAAPRKPTPSRGTPANRRGDHRFKSTKEEKIKSSRRAGGRGPDARSKIVPYRSSTSGWWTPSWRCGRWGSEGFGRRDKAGRRHHQGPAQASNSFGRQFKSIGLRRAGYDLKACQRAGLVHLEQVLPPWVVARIAGHSLDVHTARYSTNTSHLPTTKAGTTARSTCLVTRVKRSPRNTNSRAWLRDLMGKGEL